MKHPRFLPMLWSVMVLYLYLLGAVSYAREVDDGPLKRGDAGMAAKYIDWAVAAIDGGRWAEALGALERGADFADVSSDIAYLLARARAHENKPQGMVLAAIKGAVGTNQWTRFSLDEARLFEAETLIRLRRFAEALHILRMLPPGADMAYLRLRALRGSATRETFCAAMAETMEAYPRDPRPVQLLFEYLADRLPEGSEQELVSLALRRLPVLLEADRELAYGAVPFIQNIEDARTILAAYRGVSGVNRISPASIPMALYLGLIDENQALDELFPPPSRFMAASTVTLDKALLQSVWSLLRHDEGRDRFWRNLLPFTGVFIEDTNKDGYHDAWVTYQDGMITGYSYDPDQDGLPEVTVSFMAEVPVQATVVVLPEAGEEPVSRPANPVVYPVRDADRAKVEVQWEIYPAVLAVKAGDIRYTARPFEFFFAPVRFRTLFESSFRYPEWDAQGGTLSIRRVLFSADFAERPGKEMEGTIERVELDRGIPHKARTFLDGRLVSETAFALGRPTIQRIDLDVDGRLETVRYFHRDIVDSAPEPTLYKAMDYIEYLEASESDWDGDGIFEYGEQYVFKHDADSGSQATASVVRSWDMDKDGRREYTKNGIY
ncbi:MAG: hypothetical protein LBT14_07535 [Treponema sp.]|jgi:hypothetical protein|nr:hypothetical protein [Treponema sp.]